ncbi:MAG: B12-binding domain-containing radical SAM protein [Bacteroidetes bacterium]|nr:B12-binding domain-containing radical SAM protein [Bacteroidota bacterium]MBL6943544.1 B12-binding domain-containing radical SAM protein [Bacteroidales bacterium]
MTKKKYKLLLINPLSTKRIGLIRDQKSIYPPMSLAIIAALTPEHWDIELLDENFERFEFKKADLVGLTALTSQVTRAYEISEIYKKKNIPTVIGGIHVSMMQEEALTYADTVVIGEAESVWKNVILDFENKSLKRLYKGELKPLVDSPQPRIDLYHSGYAFGSVQTTRGCPMSCDFCSVHTFNGKQYRARPVKNVVDEFEKIPQDKVYFVDDNFIGYSKKSAKRVVEICKEIIRRSIKKDWFCAASMNIADHDEVLKYAAEAGCRMIFLGIESELIDQLESANKKLNVKIGINNFSKVYDKIHEYGIAVLGAFIYGLDTDTPETIENRTKYMLNSNIDAMQATILTPLPGTPLFDRLVDEHRLICNNFPDDWARYDFVEVVYKPRLMTARELTKSIDSAWKTLYDEKRLKRKFIDALKATRNPISATWSYNSNLHYHNLVFEHKKDKLVQDLNL